MQKQAFNRELMTAITYSAFALGVVSAIACASAFYLSKTQWAHKIDPLLFSPAVVSFVNLDSGRRWRFGEMRPDVIRESFDG